MTTTTLESDLERRLVELDEKVARLTELLERQEATRAATSELFADSAPILRSAYERAAATLHERDLDLGELADLALRLAEAAPDLDRALQAFQAMTGLLDDVGSLSGEAFALLASRLDELDRRGYFTFAKGGLEVIDRIVTSFDEEDIKALGDNVVLIFETVKEMTQPDVMRMLQRSARMVREDTEPPEKLSMFRLLREMRDPEVKLGIHRMLTMLRGMASPDDETAEHDTTTDKEEA